jgi:predicted nucleotide-binding protein
MTEKVVEPQDKIDELIQFSNELQEYYGYIAKIVKYHSISEKTSNRAAQLLLIIGYKSGSLGNLITELTDEKDISINGKPQNMWNVALRLPIDNISCQGAGFCVTVVNRAVGKLEEDIKRGIRDRQGNIIKHGKVTLNNAEPPKAFIAHGGKSGVMDKLRDFIGSLGIEPIIVELSASKGMSVDDKVNKYIKDADCGIVLATRGGIVDTTGKKPKQHPRLNVIDELERLRAVFPEKTILLLEKGVDLPSNLSGLTREEFARQSMDRAFTAIAKELTEMKILRAVKPPKGV